MKRGESRARLHELKQEYDMLVTFTTKDYADITMFGEIALSLLKMMGHSGSVPGAILAEDVPVSLSRLTAAIEAEKKPQHPESKDDIEVSMARGCK